MENVFQKIKRQDLVIKMDKELIIDMLEDTDIDKIVWIEIKLEMDSNDQVRMQYYSKDGQFKTIEREFE